MQNLEQLTNRLAKLNPIQQEIVAKLIERLESTGVKPSLTLDEAVDEFEHEHPELLRLLAQ